MLNIVGKRLLFFLISGTVIAIGIVALLVFGLKPGIEFSSGSLLQVTFDQPVSQGDLVQELGKLGYSNAIVQSTTGGDFLIRTATLTEEGKTQLEAGLSAKFGALEEAGFSSVSPIAAARSRG